MESSPYAFLLTPESFKVFTAAWEAGTLPGSEFTHAAHVAIGASYIVRFGHQALPRIREGIQRFNVAAGGINSDTSGYHETLTRFWWAVLLKHSAGEADAYAAAQRAADAFGDQRKLHDAYYSFNVVESVTARREWIAPDLREI